MSAILSPQKTQMGWVLEIPQEMAAALGVQPGSLAVLYPKDRVLETEILPPPSDELRKDFERLYEKYGETFEELKRVGD